MVNFIYTIIIISNVNDTLPFFGEAFKMNRNFITEENDYGELYTGKTTLAFATHELSSSNFHGDYIAVLHPDSHLAPK